MTGPKTGKLRVLSEPYADCRVHIADFNTKEFPDSSKAFTVVAGHVEVRLSDCESPEDHPTMPKPQSVDIRPGIERQVVFTR